MTASCRVNVTGQKFAIWSGARAGGLDELPLDEPVSSRAFMPNRLVMKDRGSCAEVSPAS